MKCRSFTAIVLAVAMLVSFGLCNLSVAAYSESGAIYNEAMGVYVQLGTYENEFSSTGNPFELYYSVDTFPYTYHNQDFYNSQIKGTSSFETYYQYVVNGVLRKFTITTETVTGITAQSAIANNDGNPDNHPQYRQATEALPGIYFIATFTNTISGLNNQFYGTRSHSIAFDFS